MVPRIIDFIKRHWFGLLFTAGLLARLPQLVMPYWYDEAWTAWISALPFDRMLAAVAGDVHPAGFFVLTWMVAQVAPWALRIVPLAFSLASILLVREIAKQLHIPASAQMVAVLLMALSPWQTYYGSELRGYSMLECAVLLAWLCVLRRQWMGVSIGMYLALESHNVGWLYCAVIGLYAFCQEWQSWRSWSWLQPVMSGYWALLLYLSSLPMLISQLRTVGAGYWIRPPLLADLLLTPYEFLAYGAGGVLTAVGMALTVGLILVIAVAWRSMPAVLILGAAIPLALTAALSWLMTPIYLSRTLIACAPFFYLLIALALAELSSPAWKVAATAMLLPVFAVLAVSPARADMVNRYQSSAIRDLIAADDPSIPVWHLGPATLVELHQFDLPNPQTLVDGFASVNDGHYSPQTWAALGITMRPLEIGGHSWLIVPKDELPESGVDVAQLCAVHVCQLRLAYVDHEPMYGVEVYEVWP